jgi:hypothetical protein
MNFAPAFVAFIAVAVYSSPAAVAATYEVTLPSDDANFVFRFPGKPTDAFAEAQRTTDNEHAVATRFSYQSRACAFSATLVNFHRERTARQSEVLNQGALASLNGKRPGHPRKLEDLAEVRLGNWKGRELRELTGNSATQIGIYALPHGALTIMSRWNVDDPVAVNAMKQFSTPAIGTLIAASPRTPTPPEYEFFYEVIRPVLFVADHFIGRVEQCATLFTRECVLPPELAGGGIARGQYLFHLLSHAGFERLAPLPKPEIGAQVIAEFPGMKPWLNETLLENEKMLFAKLAAVFEECPGERSAAILENLPVYQAVNFTRFWEQSDDVYARTSASIAREVPEIRQQIQSGWSSERCAATYVIARKMVGAIIGKTRPFAARDWQQISRRDRFSMGAAFAYELAFTLEHHIDPTIDDRVDPPKRRTPN